MSARSAARWCAAALAALSWAGCAHDKAPGWRERPGRVDARSYYYTDNSGLTVSTTGIGVEQPVSRHVTANLRGVADYIKVERTPLAVEHQAANQSTGHHHADMVTSASATAAGGEVAEKWRIEGMAGAAVRGEVLGQPSEARASVRAGTEPDYGTISGTLGATTELFQRNTTISAFLGYGRDTVSPVEAPPGQASQWPATHDRIQGGLTVSQLLSPALIATAGGGITIQRGALENPYRRAIVRTSLFPEAVPDERDRITAFVGVSWYAGEGFAVHLRQGFYADSWGVLAYLPEIGLAEAVNERLLITAHYRLYTQTPADFYESQYRELEPILTGDARLGPMHDHLIGFEVRWTFLGTRGGFGALTALAGYQLSYLTYERLVTEEIVAHVPSLGLSASY